MASDTARHSPDGGEPLLTIAIPTFNRLESLRETLIPLLASTLPSNKCEIRVFNNASTDGTTEWLASRPAE